MTQTTWVKPLALSIATFGLLFAPQAMGQSNADDVTTTPTDVVITDSNQISTTHPSTFLAADKMDPYRIVREVDVTGSGEIDLTRSQYGKEPQILTMYLENTLDKPVNVRIPDLKVSYLVPANTTRITKLNMLAVGAQREVPYTAEVLDRVNVVMDDSSRQLSELISRNNQPVGATTQADEEPVTQRPQPQPASRQAVRGYW